MEDAIDVQFPRTDSKRDCYIDPLSRLESSAGSRRHITALPAEIPPVHGASRTAQVSSLGVDDVSGPVEMGESEREIAGRAISRCGTPTFGSSTALPSFEEVIAKFGGRASKSRHPALSSRLTSKTGNTVALAPPKLGLSPAAKKRPSPLSVPPLPRQISPSSPVRNKVSSPSVPVYQ